MGAESVVSEKDINLILRIFNHPRERRERPQGIQRYSGHTAEGLQGRVVMGVFKEKNVLRRTSVDSG